MGGHRASGAGDDLADGPVDLAAVRADDALLDAIAGGSHRTGRPDYGFSSGEGPHDPSGADDERIAAILAAWRADIEADPMPELVSLDEAVEAIEAGHDARDRARSRTRRRMPFAVAAAAALIAVSGFTVAVHGAMPGDTLWNVSRVFFAERAERVERVEEVRRSITEANAALERNDPVAAREALERADVALPQIEDPQERAPLESSRDEVERSLAPEPPLPGAPAAPDEPAAPSPGEPEAVPAPDAVEPSPAPSEAPSPGASEPTTEPAPPDTEGVVPTPQDAPSATTTSPAAPPPAPTG